MLLALCAERITAFSPGSELAGDQTLIEQVEPRVAFRPIVHALLTTGEIPSLRGILALKEARRILLRAALAEVKTTAAQRKEVWSWLGEAEQKLATYREAMVVIGDSAVREWKLQPLARGDKLNYFLARVTRRNSFGRLDAVEALMPRCYRALYHELNRTRKEKNGETLAKARSEKTLAKLPNLLTIFVRYFPAERIEQGMLVGEITPEDIRCAIKEYAERIEEGGVFLDETRQSYINQLLRMFRLRRKGVDGRLGAQMRLSPQDVVRLGLQDDRPIYLDESVDDELREDPEIEVIAFQQPEYDSESPYESAYRLRLGGTNGNAPRAARYRSMREPGVLSPNDAHRLFTCLDRGAELSSEGARSALLVWLLFITGMPIKRLLRLRWVTNAEQLHALIVKNQKSGKRGTELYLLIEEGVVVAAPTRHVNESAGPPDAGTIYRKRADLVPLSIGRRGRKYLKTAFRSEDGRGDEGDLLLTESFGGLQRLVNKNMGGFETATPVTWLMTAAAFRAYSIAAGLTPLVSGIASGRPTRPVKTILHYVAYDTQHFYRDHDRAVSFVESLSDPDADTCRMPEGLPASVVGLTKGCIGAAYVVVQGYVAEVWSAVCESTNRMSALNNDAERLGLATIRAAFALMISTGVREQELPNLRRSLLDLDAGLLRVEGKSTYLREAREVPLLLFAVDELTLYLNLLEQLAADYDGDALFVTRKPNGTIAALAPRQIGSLIIKSQLKDHMLAPLRTLRHALRTALHESTGLYAEVNEVFGHVTLEETVCHQLSGRCLARVQNTFRLHAERTVRLLLSESSDGEVSP